MFVQHDLSVKSLKDINCLIITCLKHSGPVSLCSLHCPSPTVHCTPVTLIPLPCPGYSPTCPRISLPLSARAQPPSLISLHSQPGTAFLNQIYILLNLTSVWDHTLLETYFFLVTSMIPYLKALFTDSSSTRLPLVGVTPGFCHEFPTCSSR